LAELFGHARRESMKSPELKCSIYDTDHIAVRRDENGRLVFECRGDDGLEVEVYAKPAAVREFLRTVGAMVDEIAGEEASAPQSMADPSWLAPPTRLELLETARRIAGQCAPVESLLKIASYLEGN
jgi:hypothetical protein